MLFLSSYGFRAPLVSDKLKKYINPENKKILLIPFAGFNSKKTAEIEINEGLMPFGFVKDNILIYEGDISLNEKIDIIYVPGGNPFKLLKEAKETEIIAPIRDMINNGADYFGVSAGADFLSANIEYLKSVDDCDYDLSDFDALGIIEEKILCHTDQRDMGILRSVKEFDERNTIFIRNDELLVMPSVSK